MDAFTVKARVSTSLYVLLPGYLYILQMHIVSLCIAFFLVFYIKLDIYVGKDFCNAKMCSTFSPDLYAEP